MKRALRIISILIGVGAFVTAMRFAFTPAAAAERLGMPVTGLLLAAARAREDENALAGRDPDQAESR